MANQVKSSERKAAVVSALLSQARRSPELTKILILLIVWGHVLSRPGYTLADSGPALKPGPQPSLPAKQGFTVKRPRERFL
jgi:hypothetical protein